MSRLLTMAAVAVLFACSGEGGDADARQVCGSQAACSTSFERVCEAGFCSEPLPDTTKHQELFQFSVPPIFKRQGDAWFRIATLHAVTPDGKKVVCPGAEVKDGEVAVTSISDAANPSKFNLINALVELRFDKEADIAGGPVYVTTSSQVLYLELYGQPLSPGNLSTGGKALARSCLTPVKWDDVDGPGTPPQLNVFPTPTPL
jgi:hypothetical protein